MATSVSVALHVGLFVLLALTGQQMASTVRSLLEQTVQYLYPVPRDIGLPRPGNLTAPEGAVARTPGVDAPRPANGAGTDGMAFRQGRSGVDFAPIPLEGESIVPGLGDNAFSIVDVDSAAAFDPTSAAPEYPESMVRYHVEGRVVLRFVVDSTGLIDMATARVISATHPLFAKAVLDAMPKMRYRPARIGERAVRLLVEQAFSFKLEQPKKLIS
ncbi:MAG: energy transducer TonB [Gemmatimonadaceae bacterium]